MDAYCKSANMFRLQNHHPGTKSRPTNRQLVHFIAAPPCNRFSRCALILDWASRIWPKRLRGEALAPGRERLKKRTLACFRDFPKEKPMRFLAKQAFCEGRDADGT